MGPLTPPPRQTPLQVHEVCGSGPAKQRKRCSRNTQKQMLRTWRWTRAMLTSFLYDHLNPWLKPTFLQPPKARSFFPRCFPSKTPQMGSQPARGSAWVLPPSPPGRCSGAPSVGKVEICTEEVGQLKELSLCL